MITQYVLAPASNPLAKGRRRARSNGPDLLVSLLLQVDGSLLWSQRIAHKVARVRITSLQRFPKYENFDGMEGEARPFSLFSPQELSPVQIGGRVWIKAYPYDADTGALPQGIHQLPCPPNLGADSTIPGFLAPSLPRSFAASFLRFLALRISLHPLNPLICILHTCLES